MNDFDGGTIRRDKHSRADGAASFVDPVPMRARRLLPLVLLAPALFALGACSDPDKRAAELAQQADAFAQAGNLYAARTAISEAISLREDEPNFHLLQGVIAMRSSDLVGAYRAFNRALEFDASNRTALAYVANIGIQIGQLTEAEDAADKLLTVEPNAVAAMQVKGMIALSRDKFDQATEIGDKILAIDPRNEAGSIIKARALAKAGKPEEALTLIDTAMGGANQSAALLANKVNIYRYLGQGEPMVEPLGALVKLSNGLPRMRLDLINTLYRVGRIEEARKASLEMLAAGSRDPEDYRVLQRIWWQYDKTPVSSETAPGIAKWKEPIAVVATARYLILRGDLETAAAVIRNAPAKTQPLLASLRTRILADSKMEAEARRQVDALLTADNHDVDALMLRARFATQDKQFERALEAAQLAQTNDPQNPETYVVLAAVYRAQRADFRARQVYEEGLKTLPQNFYLLESYTQYLHQLGDKSRAISAARNFARNVASSPRAWEIMGAQCEWARDAGCMQTAYAGFQDAKKTIFVDDPPGTAPDRSLFGRI